MNITGGMATLFPDGVGFPNFKVSYYATKKERSTSFPTGASFLFVF